MIASTLKFRHALFVVSLLAGAWGLLQAQDDSSAPPPAPTADTPSVPMQDATAPAPDTSAPAPEQGQEFTADDATGATQGDASFQTFYDALSDQGTWVQSNDYGYVWQPKVSDSNWAPYTQGHWAYSDDGWTWVSDENFGWATYHYGRWANLDGYGWVWVPGYQWAPAWVSWRYGDGYAGWAPLPPDSFVGVDYSNGDTSADFGYHIGGDADSYYGIGVGYYIFLPVNYLCYRNYHGHYCDRHDNWHLIGHTSNVTNINVSHHHGNGIGSGNVAENGAGRGHRVTVGGPKLAEVNAGSANPIQKVTLGHTTQRNGGTLNGNTLAFYAPRVHTPATGATLQPAHINGSIAQATINHGTDIQKPLAVNSHLSPPAATPAQVEQARISTSQIPSTAKVVTDASTVKPVLQRPLTTMRPVTSPRPTSSPTTMQAPPNPTFHSAPATTIPGSTSANALTPTPGHTATPSAAPTQTYAPVRTYTPAPSYAPAPAQTYTQAPAESYPATRIYPQSGATAPPQPPRSYAPNTVYPSGPAAQTYAPQMHENAPARSYAPANVYQSNPPESRTVPAAAGEVPTRTYVRPMSPVAPAQAPAPVESHGSPAPAASSGGWGNNGGGGHSSGSSAGASSSSSGASSGSSSSGTSTGGGTTGNGRSH